MSKWKSFSLILVIVMVTAGAACIVSRLLRPEPSEIERVFDGTEAVFVKAQDLLKIWRILSQTDYVRSTAYEGLLSLPPVQEIIDTIHAGGGWVDRINPDAVMSAVGDESALGLYAEDGSLRSLFVSRVDPNFLLVDRILAFVGGDAGITVTPYRGMRVKEASLDGGRPLLWALDGDLLILSDSTDIFYAAIDRHVSGTSGMIAANRDFRRMKRDTGPSRLISGYAVTKRLLTIPKMREAFSGAARTLMPESLRFSLSYADGLVTLDVESARGVDPLSWLSNPKKGAIPLLGDGEIAAVRVGRMPPLLWDMAGQPSPRPPLPRLLPLLFPGGFSVLMLSDPHGAGEPGVIAGGRRCSSWTAAVARLKETSGLVERNTTIAGLDISILDDNGVPYLAWTERGDQILVSKSADLLASMPLEILETGESFGYNSPDGQIMLTIRSRLMYRELERSTKPIPIPFVDLSLDEQKRLLAALYPAESIDGYASVNGKEIKITIGIHIGDVMP